jgi:ubiquinone/menaquinone biosynthesis C-methylase UbiE
MPHLFDPANRHRLLSEDRYRAMPPDSILDRLPLHPTDTVADIGCGPGFFTLPLAERVPRGTVYAIDVAEQMLDMVTERAAEAGIVNIQTMLANDSVLDLPPASLDGALLGQVYHEFPDRIAYLRQLAALVRPGSWLALLDWDVRQNPGGGPPLEHRIAPDVAAREVEAAGWRITARDMATEWVYLLIAERQPTEG